jgi:sugar lactone lactonase YvrE
MRRILGLVLLAAAFVMVTGSASARESAPKELVLPGAAFYPESISAAPSGELFVSSLATGKIVRFSPGASVPTTLVRAGVNPGTAGVMVDPARNVLWACSVDLTFVTASELRAFDLQTGGLVASYPLPVGSLCADIALVRRDVYVTDTGAGRIFRLSETDRGQATGGSLAIWSDDPRLASGAPLKINGIAFDGRRTIYTTNYSTGELFAIRIASDGSAGPAIPIPLDTPMTNPDGIRWRGRYLYVAENANGLSRIDPRTGTRTLIDGSLDQPTSLAFVGRDVWITEGQVLRLQSGQAPNLPFKVVRRCVFG